jgi:hypothetical protein
MTYFSVVTHNGLESYAADSSSYTIDNGVLTVFDGEENWVIYSPSEWQRVETKDDPNMVKRNKGGVIGM